MEAENNDAANITAETVEAVYLLCMSSTTPGLIRIVIDGQKRIMQDCLSIKRASNFHRDFFCFDGSVFIIQLFFHEDLCHKISLEHYLMKMF